MHVATIPNRNSRPAILLRENYRENGKVKNRTLKNLSDWPAERVELLRAALRGDGLAPAGEGMEIERALPHGHVLAALGTARAIELDALLPRGKERRHQLALALIVARDEKRLLCLQGQLAKYRLLIIDELGFVPLSKTGAELLFEVFSQRYERGSILVTSNLPFDEWTEVFGSERLTGALLDRLTHHVHILECNGESYRPKHARGSKKAKADKTRPDA